MSQSNISTSKYFKNKKHAILKKKKRRRSQTMFSLFLYPSPMPLFRILSIKRKWRLMIKHDRISKFIKAVGIVTL
jgi:hypothetical protein